MTDIPDSNTILDRLAKALSNYRERDEQRRLITEIAATLSRERVPNTPVTGENILVADAPTGSGKTLGYLMGAVPIGLKRARKIVIATATVALQEQILTKDLPLLTRHGGLSFRFALAKGRGRYACRLRLDRYSRRTSAEKNDSERAILGNLARNIGRSWSGDRDSWPDAVPDDTWSKITNDRHGCTGTLCRWFKECPYYQARDQLKQADVIVANQDIVLADLTLGGGFLLPRPEETIYIVDEAHHFPDKAVRAAGAKVRLNTLIRRMEKLVTVLEKKGRGVPNSEEHIHTSTRAARQIAERSLRLREVISHLPTTETAGHPLSLPLWRFSSTRVPAALRGECEALLLDIEACLSNLALFKNRVRVAAEQQQLAGETCEKLLADLGGPVARLLSARRLFSLFLEPVDNRAPPIARWAEAHEYTDGVDYVLEACRVSAADWLRHAFFERAAGVVLTSATLRVQNQFKHFMRKTGLGPLTDTRYLVLKSPFDPARATMHMPAMTTDPKNPQAHTREVTTKLGQHLDLSEGSLVLFTSRQQMLDVYAALDPTIRARVLLQGASSRETLLMEHAARIARNEGSVLFGLNEFSEGLNLPGKLCTHVVIVKLPFAHQEDPVTQTLCEWIEARGRNSFMEVAVPETVLRLIQSVGRLLRHEDDYGRITFLDNRIVTKPYGRVLLLSLPPYPVVMGDTASLSRRAA